MVNKFFDLVAVFFGIILILFHSIIMGLYMPYLNFFINIILITVFLYASAKEHKILLYLISFILMFLIWVPVYYSGGDFGFGYLYSKSFFLEMQEAWVYLLPTSFITLVGIFLIKFNFENFFVKDRY